jgi:ABC-type lipoprotein release transport system permease subunit
MRQWIERQRYLIDFTVASLLRRKGKNAGLLAVYTLIVFMLASVMLFSQAIQGEAAAVLAEAPEVVVQRMVAGRHALIPAEYLDRLGRIRGVRRKEARLWGYFYDPAVAANYTFMVPRTDPPPAGQVAIGAGIARARGADPGDVLSFRSAGGELFSFTVARVLAEETGLVSADLVLVSEADFRGFFGIPAGRYTDIALTVANPREVEKVAQKVALRLPDARPILREEILRTYGAVFDWREGILLVLLAGALLAFVIFVWDRASGLSAEERREIGVLKAIGWETGDVLRMRLWEGALISLAAFLMGYVLAYGHVFLLGSPLFEPVLKGWSVLYPRFDLAPRVDGLGVATLFFFTVVPYTAATLVPVWRSAVTDPDEVMR